MASTIDSSRATMPGWVAAQDETRYAWETNLSWRMQAIDASSIDDHSRAAWRAILRKEAERMYDRQATR